jgi:hypothetical protein
VGCSGEAVARVDGAGGWSVRVVDGRSSWRMKRMAQQCSGAFSLRMVARRRDSYSEATRAHEDGDAGVGGCWGLGSQCCMVAQ